MEEYVPNSNRSKQQAQEQEGTSEKVVKKIVDGKVKKKGTSQKIANMLFSEDTQSVKSYIFGEVLIPGIKKIISDVATNGIDILLYGEAGHSNGHKSPGSRVSYNGYYENQRQPRRDYVRSGYDYDDVLVPTRGDAEEIIMQMDELISKYGIVSVADLYDLVGVACNYTDNKYGWTDIRTAEPMRTRDGYTIKLPRAMPIN